MITLDELLVVKELCWPGIRFADYQVEIIESWCSNRETVVVAGTELGKDFVAGFINLGTFLACQGKGITCKLLTVSVAEDHLKVLWGEIGRLIQTSRLPLSATVGGPLVINHMEVRRREEQESKNPFNYLSGMVYQLAEKLQGHYADFNGVTFDEASGIQDDAWIAVQTMKRILAIGNANQCQNWYRRAIREGSIDEPILVRS